MPTYVWKRVICMETERQKPKIGRGRRGTKQEDCSEVTVVSEHPPRLNAKAPEEGPSGLCDMEFPVTLGPDDFLRLGVRKTETRLAVIRNAALKAARALAVKQLADPNESTQKQLSQVAVSAYRLLDPRQRDDRYSRVHIGRIRPGALHQAGHAEFADHRLVLKQRRQVLPDFEFADRDWKVDPPPEESMESGLESVDAQCGRTEQQIHLSDASIVAQEFAAITQQRRRRLRHPAVLATMILLLLTAAGSLLMWGQLKQAARMRLESPGYAAEK
ncbi:hypothetical protein [Roseiconus lacunae]|uniref:hypothetical protein n=1 Tax=Roseiconus lacunae TaxID=2605694 RepID=UPI0011F30986|nr:hypothetical protein [Roseiconus lacunae]MCD0458352.1 hypothetical protein [Roseiconus lacunae]WRQ52155.1 hypothetical protein U8335_06335 [Stieleria sp. HD01]